MGGEVKSVKYLQCVGRGALRLGRLRAKYTNRRDFFNKKYFWFEFGYMTLFWT